MQTKCREFKNQECRQNVEKYKKQECRQNVEKYLKNRNLEKLQRNIKRNFDKNVKNKETRKEKL